MSSKSDQKRLEFLYEQVNSKESLELLEDEQRFVEEVSALVFRRVSRNYDNLPLGSILWSIISFTEIKQCLKETIKDFPNEILQYFEKVYLFQGVYESLRNIWLFQKITQGNKKEFVKLKFAYPSNPYVIKQVLDFQKQPEESLEEIKKVVTLFLEHSLTQAYEDKDFVQWREEKVKFRNLRKKLPELEGIFD